MNEKKYIWMNEMNFISQTEIIFPTFGISCQYIWAKTIQLFYWLLCTYILALLVQWYVSKSINLLANSFFCVWVTGIVFLHSFSLLMAFQAGDCLVNILCHTSCKLLRLKWSKNQLLLYSCSAKVCNFLTVYQNNFR